jgi:lipoprotein-anchoring transpeptidase ErfK/SrfK
MGDPAHPEISRGWVMQCRSGVLCAILALGSAALAGQAVAQYAPAPGYRDAPASSRGLPPSWLVDNEDDGPQLPPPGYYPSSQQPSIARGPADQDAIRPPADIATRATPAPSPQPGAQAGPAPAASAALPPEDQPEVGEPKVMDPRFKKQLVNYTGSEPAGTIIIDTANKFLFLTLGGGKAIRYGIGVGREGFTWAGTERVSRMAEWPDWHPPAEMIERQPYLPRFMAGGDGNPLGARALYLGKTLYRIHGTNQPSTIGTNVSSGCIRLVNADIEDLYSRVQTGTRVVVLPNAAPVPTAAKTPAPQQTPAGAPMQVGANNGATGSVTSAPLPATR